MGRPHKLARSALGERVRESFVMVPLAGMVFFAVLAPATAVVDVAVGHFLVEYQGDLQVSPKDWSAWVNNGRTVIQTVGPATLTVMGVVFSITLVALQMATDKLSPRIVHLFTRSWTTKLTLTVFLGTFVYTIGVLYLGGLLSDQDNPFVPVVSTTLSILLLLLCLLSFLFFVQGTVDLMRVTSVMDHLTRGTLSQIRRMAPAAPPRSAPEPSGTKVTRVSSQARAGVLTWVDERGLAAWARRNDAFVRVLPRIGDHVPTDSVVLSVRSGRQPRAVARAARTLRTGRERSTYQDPAFGLRQIVDIGVRAQAFGENDPTTVVQCVDRIQTLVEAFAEVTEHTWTVHDHRGVARVLMPLPTWEGFVELAFSELVLQCEGHTQVTRRLSAALRDLEERVDERRRPAIRHHRDELRRVCERHLPEHLVGFALTPDHQGLGGGGRGSEDA